MRILTLLCLLAITLSTTSCVTLFAPNKQGIEFRAPRDSKVYVNGERARRKKGKLLLPRNRSYNQITVEREGHLDAHGFIKPSGTSAVYAANVPFLFVGGIGLLGLATDIATPKFKRYGRNDEVRGITDTEWFGNREEGRKNVWVNKISVDIASQDYRVRTYNSYQEFERHARGGNGGRSVEPDEEDIQLDETVFAPILNNILVERGYVDTTETVLKNSYADNVYLNSTIVGMEARLIGGGNSSRSFLYGVTLDIEWELLDYYKKPIKTLRTKTLSDYIVVFNSNSEESIFTALRNAVEKGMIEFMASEDVREGLIRGEAEEWVVPPALTLAGTDFVSSPTDAVKSSVTVRGAEGHGSGFLISSDGYIVTNVHVLSGMDPDSAEVVLNDGQKYPFTIVREDRAYDLAVIKIDATGFKPFRMNGSKDVPLAEDIFVIGTPRAEDFQQTISRGIVSGVRNRPGGGKLIQTDASVNAGNSGGAIITADGTLLGVMTLKIQDGTEGVNFGIPAHQLVDRLGLKNVGE